MNARDAIGEGFFYSTKSEQVAESSDAVLKMMLYRALTILDFIDPSEDNCHFRPMS